MDSNYLGMIPIQKTDVYREVIDRISKLIDDNEFTPGQRLPSERELAERLGVSRTTLRQGIKVLESMGRVETRVGSGTYVCPDQIPQVAIQDIEISKKGVADLIAVRCGIENTALLAFFETARTSENIAALQEIVREHAGHRKDSVRRGYKYNFEFEETIAQMTGNRILILQQQQVHALWSYVWGKLGFLPRIGHASIDHNNVIDALRDGERDLACIYMRKHVQRNLDELFAEHPEC